MGKKKRNKIFILAISIFLSIVTFLMYGPYKGLSDLWILTAMHTSEHEYLATTFYTQNYIDNVMAKHEIKISEEKTDPQVQFKREASAENKLTEISSHGFVGHLLSINDPEDISLVSSSKEQGETIEQIVSAHQASGGINASGYEQLAYRGIADGITIVNGKTVTSDNAEFHQMGGINEDGLLVVGRFSAKEIDDCRFKWAVEAGPVLIVNGERIEMSKMAGGIAPRTAIGQTTDGTILLLVIDGRQTASVGASLYDVQNVLFEYGAVNAINLDGGASSSMIFNGRLINSPSNGNEYRDLPNAIVIK